MTVLRTNTGQFWSFLNGISISWLGPTPSDRITMKRGFSWR